MIYYIKYITLNTLLPKRYSYSINKFVGKLGSAARVDERENKLEIEMCER